MRAAICGALSNPHDRYQSRLTWLAALVVAIDALDRRRQRQTVQSQTVQVQREPIAAQVALAAPAQTPVAEDGLAVKP